MPFTSSDISYTWASAIKSPSSTSTFVITDAVAWATDHSIDPTDVSWVVDITYPSGTTVQGTFGGGGNTGNLSFPLDSSGAHMKGRYSIKITITVSGSTDPGTYTLKDTISNYCPVTVTPEFTWTINCTQLSPIVSVSDGTSYPTGHHISSRALNLFSAEPGTDYTSSGPITNSGTDDAFRGVWKATLSTTTAVSSTTTANKTVTTTYTVTEKVDNKVVSSASHDVQCKDLCELNCLLRKAYGRWEKEACNDFNSPLYVDWLKAQAEYQSAVTELNDCGSTPQYQKHVDALYLITNSSEDCGCATADTSDYITVLGSSSAANTFLGSGYVQVTTSGSNVTYSLTQFATDVISNARLYSVTSTGLTVTSSTNTGTTPDTVTYNLEPPESIQARDSITFIVTLSNIPTSSGNVPTLAQSAQVIKGSEFQNATLAALGGTGANVSRITVSGFDAGSLPTTWKADVNFMGFVAVTSISSAYTQNGYVGGDVPLIFQPRVVSRKTSGPSFEIAFYPERITNGSPGFWYQIGNWATELTLRVDIHL